MTTVTGTIRDSLGQVISGRLTVTLDSLLIDTSTAPDSINSLQPATYTITAGVININIPESQTKNVTYRFLVETSQVFTRYWFQDGTNYTGPFHLWATDGLYYTGATHSSDSQLLSQTTETVYTSILDFRAIVPNVSSIEFASLVPTGITTEILDTSIWRLANLLTTITDYVEILKGGYINRGNYSNLIYYQKYDLVAYAGSSWAFISNTPAIASTPSLINADWQLIAAKGDPGGTGGNDVAYNATGWDGATWAPSANAVRDIIETLARANDAVLTGNPTAPTQAVGNDSTRLATTAFVNAKITDRFIDAALTGNPTVPTQLQTVNDTKAASTAFVKTAVHRYAQLIDSKTSGTAGGSAISGINTRDLNTIAANTNSDVTALSSNTFTLRTGTYRIYAAAPAHAVDRHRIFLWNNTAGSRILSGLSSFCSSTIGVATQAILRGTFTLASNTDLQIRHYTSTARATDGLGVATIEASIAETYCQVELWRID